MAKNQLLHVLVRMLLPLYIVLLITLTAKGSGIATHEIMESTVPSNEISQEAMLENAIPERSYARLPYAQPSYVLRVFVSSSAPISLLKSYGLEAKKYNATLVFKGLPNGSFKELSKLVLAMKSEGLEEDNDMSSIQIDDETFDRFKITSVPSIVLSDESACDEPIASCKLTYDKIDGAIDIKTALEKFASGGDMKEAAIDIMKQVNSETGK